MKKNTIIIFMVIAAAFISIAITLFSPAHTQKTNQQTIKTSNEAKDYLVEKGLILMNKNLPGFSLFDTKNNKEITITETNKAALIHVWALWCGPCKKELPILDKASLSLNSHQLDLFCVVSGVDQQADHTKKGIESFYKEKNIKHLPIHIDKSRALINYLQVLSYPSTYLVKDGKIVGYFKRPLEWSSKMIKALKLFLEK